MSEYVNLAQGQLLDVLDSKTRRIEIHENDHYRWLTFNSAAIQSVLSFEQPNRLVLPYSQAMMVPLLFNVAPQNALILGAGGGALIRFLRCNLQEMFLTAVEHSSDVMDMSQRFLQFPHASDLLKIMKLDAHEYLKQNKNEKHDLVLVDLYKQSSMPGYLLREDFYENIYACLSKKGIVAINFIFQNQEQFLAVYATIRNIFQYRTLCLSVSDYSNTIVFAFKETPQELEKKRLLNKAAVLTPIFDINFKEFVELLFEINPSQNQMLTI